MLSFFYHYISALFLYSTKYFTIYINFFSTKRKIDITKAGKGNAKEEYEEEKQGKEYRESKGCVKETKIKERGKEERGNKRL